MIRLRLYVAGSSPNSVVAVATLKALLAEFTVHVFYLEVIDVLSDPLRGARDGILVTPMLVKYEPAPERRVLGNLRDRTTVLGALGLHEAARV